MIRRSLLLGLLTLTGCDEALPPPPAAPDPRPPAASPAFTGDDGREVRPLADDGRRATVLLFLMRDCPVANATAPEIARLATDFTPAGVRFFGVYATETADEIKTHRAEHSLNLTGLMDPDCRLARLTGATRVPQAAVLSPSGELLYLGRIDDRAVRPGVTRPEPTRRDLRLALEAVAAGKIPDPKATPAVGCYLPVP